MSDQPRLGAALIFGATAEHAVHVHTDPDGIAAIWVRLDELNGTGKQHVPVVAVFGMEGPVAATDRYEIPADAVEDLVAFALGLNR